jgi:hypothetical protein
MYPLNKDDLRNKAFKPKSYGQNFIFFDQFVRIMVKVSLYLKANYTEKYK